MLQDEIVSTTTESNQNRPTVEPMDQVKYPVRGRRKGLRTIHTSVHEQPGTVEFVSAANVLHQTRLIHVRQNISIFCERRTNELAYDSVATDREVKQRSEEEYHGHWGEKGRVNRKREGDTPDTYIASLASALRSARTIQTVAAAANTSKLPTKIATNTRLPRSGFSSGIGNMRRWDHEKRIYD